MTPASASAEEIVALALAVAGSGEVVLHATLAALPAPIYLTDADGWISWFNPACVDFAGRTPVPGRDRWCVTWKLYTLDGAPLPHEDCPMAVAVRERRPVRGMLAVAERPDGTRVMFAPYPTPIVGPDGAFAGAVNILIDATDRRQAESLRAQAMRCRRLAQSVTDQHAVDTLLLMAAEYDEKARGLATS